MQWVPEIKEFGAGIGLSATRNYDEISPDWTYTIWNVSGAEPLAFENKSLWFPIGLHAGWVFAYAAFNLYYNPAKHPLHPWGVGDNLRSGVVPLLALITTAVVCHFIIRQLMCPCRKKKTEDTQSA